MSSIAIKYENENFEAGKEVSGKIILLLTRPLKIRKFRMSLVLKVQASWREKCCFTFVARDSIESGPIFTVHVGNKVFETGTHEIPFNFRLDSNLPATCNQRLDDAMCNLLYRLTVEGVTSSLFRRNIRTIVPISIHENSGRIAPDRVDYPIVVHSTNKVGRLVAIIDKDSFFLGEEVNVTVSLRNDSYHEVRCIEVQICYRISTKSSRCFESSKIYDSIKVAKSVKEPVLVGPNEMVENLAIKCRIPMEPWRTVITGRIKVYASLVVLAPAIQLNCPITIH